MLTPKIQGTDVRQERFERRARDFGTVVELHWIGATLGDIAELRDIQLTALVTLR